ncbi:MAG: hypothetical protein JSS02_18475 [Planctomycetes bacterium]|nr:hypothetical protein [Planctomycetota bacterium]
MGLPKAGSRLIVIEGRRLRWRIRYDRMHWSEGWLTPVRVVVADATAGGPRLVAEFVGGRRSANEQLRVPFAPRCVRRLVEAGLAAGWQPGVAGQPDVHLGQAEVEACDIGSDSDAASAPAS